MFSRLGTPHSIYDKENNISYTDRFTQQKSARKKNHSTTYTTLHSPRLQQPTIPHIYHTSTHHYQIPHLPRTTQKHGEGILIMHDGTCVIGNWRKGLLNGRTLIFTPFGGRIITNYINGKMNGWCVGRFGQETVVITHYFEDKIDGERVVFDGLEGIWVTSHYTPEGKFLSMVHVEAGTSAKLPSFVLYEGLEEFYQQVLCNQLGIKFVNLKHIHIDTSTEYIGFCTQEGQIPTPDGLGITFSENQMFLGGYQNGTLNKLARMYFKSGEIYHGGVAEGFMFDNGFLYSPMNNTTNFIKTDCQQSKLFQRIQGYFYIDFNYRLGKDHKNQKNIGFSIQGIKELSETLSKYYYSYFINKKKVEQNMMSRNSNPSIEKRNIEEIPSSNIKWLSRDFEGESEQQKANKFQPSQKGSLEVHSQQELEIFQNSPIISPKNREIKSNFEDFQTLKIEENLQKSQIEDYEKKIPKSPMKTKMMLQKSAINYVQKQLSQDSFGHNSEGMRFGMRKQSVDKNIFKKKSNEIEEEVSEYINDSQVSNLTSKVSQFMKKSTKKRQKIFTKF